MLHKLLLSYFLITLSLLASAKNRPLKFCYEDQDSFPWVLKNGKGLNLTLLRMTAKKLGVELQLIPVP